MSDSFENADYSFTFDTSLSAEFDLTTYAGIIYELAVVPPKHKKLRNEDVLLDCSISKKDNDNTGVEDDDFNQTYLTDDFNQIFSYFDDDVEQVTDNSDDELKQYCVDSNKLSDREVDCLKHRKFDIKNEAENISNNIRFELKNEENLVSGQRCNEIISNGDCPINQLCDNLEKELGIGNVREKVLMYNEMLDKMKQNLECEKNFFRQNIEEHVYRDNKLIDWGGVDKTIASNSDFDFLSEYVKKLSSIESYAQIISRLNRLVNAISQLDKNRLNGMNLKSLKNFLYFIKIYSDECVNMSSSVRKDIAIDLEKNVLSHEDLLYCLDVVANEVNPLTNPLTINLNRI